ncbi:MAG TPA: hypothetical protein VNZ26_30240 [Vicinamibacterales bacterium]|nr:hypothetical protein [Vicinamibacterales bacterium]
MSTFRVFYLTLFVMAAVVVVIVGWSSGAPWSACAFVVFFASRVGRYLIKHPEGNVLHAPPVELRANRFIRITAAGWLASGLLFALAGLTGEGLEWVLAAPCFFVVGLMNLYLASY